MECRRRDVHEIIRFFCPAFSSFRSFGLSGLFVQSVWTMASLGKWEDRLLTLNKKTDQNRNDIEGGKKTQYNCNRHTPIFPPKRFELMPDSSPKRFFASGLFQQSINPVDDWGSCNPTTISFIL